MFTQYAVHIGETCTTNAYVITFSYEDLAHLSSIVGYTSALIVMSELSVLNA